MKKSIFGFILAILLICPFMSQVLRAEARDTDNKAMTQNHVITVVCKEKRNDI